MIPLAVQAAAPCALGALTLLASESPVWHILRDRSDQAHTILMSLRSNNTEVVNSEINTYKVAAAEEAARRRRTRFWDVLNRANLKRTLTAGAFLSASQVGGQILILQYSTVILVQSGVADPFRITVIISCLQFLGTLVGPTLLDKFGRRPIAFYGFTVLFLLNMAAGGLAAADLTTEGQRKGLAAVFIVFAFFNAVCFQSLYDPHSIYLFSIRTANFIDSVFLIPAEIATVSLREPTMSWSLFWSYVTAVITTFAVPQITAADAGNLGAKAAFIFAGCVLVTVVFTYFYLPETKNRSVVEIDEMYNANLPMRKWRDYQCASVSIAAEKVQHEVQGGV
jgi:Sugar (and other) transporter